MVTQGRTLEELKPNIQEAMELALGVGDGESPEFDITIKELGPLQEAVECLDDALMDTPDDPLVLAGKCVVLSKLGRFQEAVECFDEAARIRPDFYKAFYGDDAVPKEQF